MRPVDFSHSLSQARVIAFVGLLSTGWFALTGALAQDAMWQLAPASSDWNTAINWLPPMIPAGTASFGPSNTASISFSAPATTISTLLFQPNASAYRFNLGNPPSGLLGQSLDVTGSGIINQSSFTPTLNLNRATLTFHNSSQAGNSVISTQLFSTVDFRDNSSSGSSSIANSSTLLFHDASSAGAARIKNTGPATIEGFTAASPNLGRIVFGAETALGTATIQNDGGTISIAGTAERSSISNNQGGTFFGGTATAANARISNTAGICFLDFCTPLINLNGLTRIALSFNENSTAGAASITNSGGNTGFFNATSAGTAKMINDTGGFADFFDSSTAAGSNIANGVGGRTTFHDMSSAGAAVITTNSGGSVFFQDSSSGGQARFITNSGGVFDISDLAVSGMTAGSIEGAGTYFLGSKRLTIGGNNLSTEVTGTIADGGIAGGAGGSLVKEGSGTLTLSGANTYTGATTINAGILALGSGGSIMKSSGVSLAAPGSVFDVSRSGSQTIQDLTGVSGSTLALGPASLSFGTGNSTSFAGTITGSGTLTKQGSGSFTLTGDSSGFGGATNVAGGTLTVGPDAFPHASLGGVVNVEAGGAVTGLGSLGTLNNQAGIVAPGGSIGTLRVNGNFAQGPGGMLAIEVTPSAASRLSVGGSASLGGRLALLYDPGTYTARNYTILSAQSVSGSFAAVSGNTPSGFGQSVAVSPTDVQLQLASAVPPTPVPPVVPTPPPIVIAPRNDTIFPAVSSALILNGQRLTGILLDRLGSRTGGIADGPLTASVGTAAPPHLATSGNIAALGDFAAALPGAFAVEGAWFRGVGGFASLDRGDSAPGFNASSGGFLAGFDRPVAPNLFLGIAAGYLHTDVNEHALSNGRVDSGRVALYGGGWWGPSLLTGTAGYAYDWISTARSLDGIGSASGGHDGHELAIAGQWSLPLPVPGIWGTATVTPKLGVQYLHLYETGFKEAGASGFNLSAGNNDIDSVQPFVGVAASEKYVTAGGTEITPELRLGYSREVASNNRVLTVAAIDGTPFLTRGVRPGRDLVTAGAGITMRAQDNLYLYANYDAVLHTGNTSDQTVSAGLRIRF
jgi:outer membrane autotransporter protein